MAVICALPQNKPKKQNIIDISSALCYNYFDKSKSLFGGNYMKRFISAILLVVVIFMAIFMMSCDFDTSDTSDTTSDSTSESGGSDTSAESNQPQQAIKVDSVNGLDAKGLYEKYQKLCLEMKNFEVTSVTTEVFDGVEAKTTMNAKFGSNGKIYFKITAYESTSEFWIGNNEAYCKMEELKFKIINFKLSEFMEDSLSNTLSGIDNKKLQGASLYKSGESYYFSITLSADEALEMGYEAEAHTATFYFDSNGNVTKTVVASMSLNETEMYSNVGKNVTVSMPMDTSAYTTVDYDEIFGDNDQAYEAYEDLFDAVKNAKCYVVESVVEEGGKSTRVVYGIDMGGNQYCEDGDEYCIRKTKEGNVYVGVNGNEQKVNGDLSKYNDALAKAAKSRDGFLAFKDTIAYMPMKLEYDGYVEKYVLHVYAEDLLIGFLFNDDMTYIEAEFINEDEGTCLSYEFFELNNTALDLGKQK